MRDSLKTILTRYAVDLLQSLASSEGEDLSICKNAVSVLAYAPNSLEHVDGLMPETLEGLKNLKAMSLGDSEAITWETAALDRTVNDRYSLTSGQCEEFFLENEDGQAFVYGLMKSIQSCVADAADIEAFKTALETVRDIDINDVKLVYLMPEASAVLRLVEEAAKHNESSRVVDLSTI